MHQPHVRPRLPTSTQIDSERVGVFQRRITPVNGHESLAQKHGQKHKTQVVADPYPVASSTLLVAILPTPVLPSTVTVAIASANARPAGVLFLEEQRSKFHFL